MGCIEKGNQSRETTRDSNDAKMKEYGYPIRILLLPSSTISILPLKQSIWQNNWANKMPLTQSLGKRIRFMENACKSGIWIINSNFVSILGNKITPSLQQSILQAKFSNTRTASQSFWKKIFCMNYVRPYWNTDCQFKSDTILRNKITSSTRKNYTVDNWGDT